MTRLRARFDGKVLVPEEPVDLPVDCALEVLVEPVVSIPARQPSRPLMALATILRKLPVNPDWPADGAVQHDHYLYGVPKRP